MATTVKEVIKALQDIVKEKPEAANYPLIYSIDDEGNAYHQVYNNPSLAQVEDLKQYYLDIVGFYCGDNENLEEGQVVIKDTNCVIIN